MKINLKKQGALPALLCGAALLLLIFMSATAQTPTRLEDLPPPPPPMPTPKPTPTPAPKEPDDSSYDVVRVSSNLVVVPVSVTDDSGQPVLGLTPTDFRLEEEGRQQEIAQIGDPEQVPLDIAILLDVSGSINARFSFEKEAASRFLKQVLKPSDRATVYAIDRTPRLEMARDTADRAAARLVAINAAKGPTAFYDTVMEAARYLEQASPAQHRRVIVAITDGEDNFSEAVRKAIGATREEQNAVTPQARGLLYDRVLQGVEREMQRAEATFYSINPSGEALRLNVISQRAQNGMTQLANATGGNSFVPERLENLDSVFRQIAAELRSQYLLQYYSKDESPSGKFLRIRVQIPARPQLRIRARKGYYSRRK